LFGAVAKLAGITFSRLAFSYWIDNLGFLLRGKLAAIFIKPCSWGFQLAGHLLHQLHAKKFSGTIQHRATISPYHALLGRPALAKFMAIPHYAYLKMKLPSPRGVITITGCYMKSIECARASSKLVEALVIAEEKRQLLQRVPATQTGHPAPSQPAPHLKPASGPKEVPPKVGKEAEAFVSGAGPSSR
jgi:hypothetical protein